MDLLYLYPDKNDAPAKVGKSIIDELYRYRSCLPFENIKLIINENESKDKRYNFETVTLSEILCYPRDYIIHIPISPNVMPNKKFLLNIYSIIKKRHLILHYHGDFRENIRIQLKYRNYLDYMAVPSAIFIPLILRKTSQVITHSYFLNKIIKNKYGVKNSVVIPNGVDDFWFNPIKDLSFLERDETIRSDAFKVFFHGRLAPEKGIDLLIRAIFKVLKDKPNLVLYIAGEGGYKKHLIELCEELKIKENVFFLGNLDREHIKLYLNYVNIAIYPSRFDAFCLAAMEAFACSNCPVYFSETAGVYDFVTENGYQLKHFEPTISNIINVINSEYVNTDESIVKLQKEFANNYKWNIVIKKYIELYWSFCNC